jgi:hypothetical protein
MKKLTIEYIRAEFEREGYTLLSEEYIDNKQLLIYLCTKHHKHKISFVAWQRGQRCKKCVDDSLRKDIKDIRYAFYIEGYSLLTKNYINSKQNLYCVCPNGHKTAMTWSNWQAGYRCRYCAKNVRHTLEFVKASFEKESYTLLSTEYKNQKQKLNYICSQGHNNNITWTDWYSGGYRCPTCFFIKNSGSGNHGWRGGISFESYCEVWKDKEYKKDIRERDNNKCLNPYCDSKNSNDLTIHHIDYNKKNCSPSNLITICRSCNNKANKDREWHITWYSAILYNRYKYKY